jgi:hypothetical protein
MRANLSWIVALLLAMGLAACKKEGAVPGASAAGLSTGGGTEAGAKALLEAFLKPGADLAALTKPLLPTKADCEAVFVGDAAGKAAEAYSRAIATGQVVIRPNPGQTQLLLFSATTDDFKKRTDKAREFPGGYGMIAEKLKPGLAVYRWKFVEPGKTLGMAYDGLYYINGKWTWLPKPWRFLR